MNIEFKEGAVCYADGSYLYANNVDIELDGFDIVREGDFKLNEIKQGDYIAASELDTEQKYNDAVEVLGLFGFDVSGDFKWFKDESSRYDLFFIDECKDLDSCVSTYSKLNQKLTYQQLMAIGELKRMMNKTKQCEQSSAITEKTKTASDYLKECISVQKERGEQYDSSGTGERSFDAAAKAFNALTGGSLKGSDVCLLLTCVKAVRQYSNPNRLHDDSLLDGVSYMSIWAEELNKELK